MPTKVNLKAQPSTYQEFLNSIDKSEELHDYSIRHQRMRLDETPFFTKNQIDVAVARSTAKQFGFIMLAFVIGLGLGWLACHIR